MAWVLTKQLQAFRDQMDAAFPDRDRHSDGTIGDAAHQAEKSGHNPDRTANAEYQDGDSKDEVRAIDVDSDTGDPDVSLEDIVQHLLRLARAGRLTMIRYMIFNRRIWSAGGGWQQQPYTGPSPHSEHLHMSGAYNQASDELSGVNYHLEDLVALSTDDKAWLSAEILKQVKAAVADVPHDVLGYDPGVTDKASGSTWPGVSSDTYADKGNGTVALGTAVSSLLARRDADRALLEEIAAKLPAAPTA